MRANRQTSSGPVTDGPNKPAALSTESKATEADKVRPQDLFPYEAVRDKIKGAWEECFDAWRRIWRPVVNYPPRGVVLVTGVVKLATQKGWLIVDCKAFWDPKTRQYVADNFWIKVRLWNFK